jgi:hypothetical protein
MAESAPEVRVKLHLGDVVAYQAVDHEVEGILDYALTDRTLRLVAMVPARAPGGELAGGRMPDGTRICFVEPIVSADRLLLLSEIAPLDISSPPPSTIYHHGESYLLILSGETTVSITGQVAGRKPGACRIWRYRAAGSQCLQIEQWTDTLRMLAGTAIHKGMLEVRPARP